MLSPHSLRFELTSLRFRLASLKLLPALGFCLTVLSALIEGSFFSSRLPCVLNSSRVNGFEGKADFHVLESALGRRPFVSPASTLLGNTTLV